MAETEKSPSKFFAQPLATSLAAALLLGYAVVTGFAVFAKSHRASLEHADASTGVGDKTFFPQSFDPAVPLVNFDGHALYFVETKNVADTSMVKVGMDDAKAYAIYKSDDAKDAEASSLYLKLDLNYYLKAKRR